MLDATLHTIDSITRQETSWELTLTKLEARFSDEKDGSLKYAVRIERREVPKETGGKDIYVDIVMDYPDGDPLTLESIWVNTKEEQ